MATSLLLGLIGAGIQASRAPALHEGEADEQGLHCIYKLIDLEQLKLGTDALSDLLIAAERMGFAGLNITHPCKQAVIPLLTELSSDARAIGAVNTVLLRDGRRIGNNTDWYGFAESFREGLPDVPLGHVVQLGAGGAGSAVAYAAAKLGVQRLTIFDIDTSRARSLADQICTQFGAGRAVAGSDIEAAMQSADGLINTTPIGMVGHPGIPIAPTLLRSSLWVTDVIYFPLETELLRTARDQGCRVLDGGGMAVHQAVEAFRLFTGIPADSARMRRHFIAMGPPG
ncbi:MAG TPA: shikimate dehydrogenase [Acetobacteraceae bacterium]|jgi:shikimate dehydrogenase|nr:shikimate dehydrogenase [Acetobacteraceae bacterium]